MNANPPSVASDFRTRFTQRFLKSLAKILKQDEDATTATSPSFPSSELGRRRRRYCRVKAAAEASMARASGSRKAWSRALLWRLRNRVALGQRQRQRRRRLSLGGRRRSRCMGQGQAEELRRLVPGGEGMEFYRLLEETRDYIGCLTAQVQVMRNVASNLLSA